MVRLSPISRLFGSLFFTALVACSGQHAASNHDGDDADEPAAAPAAATATGTPGAAGAAGAPGTTSGAGPKGPAPSIVDAAALPDGDVETVPASCTSTGIEGNGKITRTTRNATGFTKVASEIAGNVVIQEGSKFNVQVETDSNVQDVVTTEVKDGELVVDAQGTYCTHRLRIIVTMPAFRGAQLDGSGNVDITKQTAASDVDLDVTGSGNMTFAGEAAALRISLSGSGMIRLTSGSATSTAVELSGSGNVDASSFSTGAITQNVTGPGNIRF